MSTLTLLVLVWTVVAAVFSAMTAHLTLRQITDVNIIAGYYLCIASSVIAMEVEPDPPKVMQDATSFHRTAERG